MKKSIIKRQKSDGFALITVMVISFLGSLVVFDTMKENVNQEKMAGNYTKELNARIQAENGLASAYNAINSDSSMSVDDMMTSLNGTQSSTGGYHYNLSQIVDASLSSDEMGISSTGSHYEGSYDIRGTMTLGASSGNNVFTGAVTTCDGATIGSGGVIDSYDSSEGAYDSSNPGMNGDITVLSDDSSASLDFSGSADVYGNLSVNGDISFTNGRVYGDAYASGTITTNNSGEASIGGAIDANGDVSYNSTDSSNVPDSISSDNNVEIGNTSFDGDVSYGGDDGGYYSSNSSNSIDDVTEYNADHVRGASTETCDILDLASEFDDTTDGLGSLDGIASTDITFGYPNNNYVFNDSGITAYDETWNVQDWVDVASIPETIDFLGEETSVYVVDITSFGDATKTITIESGSDVTIYLSGDTSIGGSIIVEDGATLTLITADTVTMDSNGSITNTLDMDGDGIYETESAAVTNSDGDIATILYSGYESTSNSDYGITLQGNTQTMMTAYAPETAMKIQASGSMYGSIRSNYLSVTNTDVGLHYDEQMANANVGDDLSSNELIITRWY
jgi:hypothetical protein